MTHLFHREAQRGWGPPLKLHSQLVVELSPGFIYWPTAPSLSALDHFPYYQACSLTFSSESQRNPGHKAGQGFSILLSFKTQKADTQRGFVCYPVTWWGRGKGARCSVHSTTPPAPFSCSSPLSMTSSCRPYVHPSHHFYTRVLLGNLFKFSKPLPNCHHLNQSPWTLAGVKEQTELEEGTSCFYNVWGCAGLCQTWVAHLPPIQLLDQGFCVTKKNNDISNHLHCGLSCGRRMKLILGTWNGWYLQADSDLREGNICKIRSVQQ